MRTGSFLLLPRKRRLLKPPRLADNPESIAVTINTNLSDSNIRKLFAWIKCAFDNNDDDKNGLISNMYGSSTNAFVNAHAEGLSRYQGTTRMAGNVLEYRDADTGRIIGFAHEVVKGRTMRGQWFFCDNDAATRYVWFHSVSDLVRRAIEDDRIDVVDLGPSGSDAFTELKEKYGFIPVVDWPAAADYSGDFIYEDCQNEVETMGDEMIRMIEALTKCQGKLNDND